MAGWRPESCLAATLVDLKRRARLQRDVLGTGEQGSLSLELDRPRSRDEIPSREQRRVLLLDRTTSERMVGFTLDPGETPEGKKLTIR